MSEATATTATTTEVPAPVPVNAPPPAAPPSDLASAVGEYKGHMARAMGKKEPEAEAAPAVEVKTDDKPADKPAEEAKAKTDEPAKVEEPAKPAEPVDEVSEGMSRILRQQRAISRQQREIEASKAAIAAEKEANAAAIADARKFEEARKRSPVEAVEQLLGKELEGTFPVDLLTHLAQKQGDAPLTPEQQEQAVAERAAAIIQAKHAEAQAAREAEEARIRQEAETARKAQSEANRTAFFEGLAVQLGTDAAKYPYLVADPVGWDEVDAYVQAEFAKTKVPPAPEAILKHFDSRNEEKAKRLADVYNKRLPAPAPKPKESPTAAVSKSPASDTRGRIETPPKGETHRERLDRVARELDAQFGR